MSSLQHTYQVVQIQLIKMMKGHYVVLGKKIQTQNFNIHSINEVIIHIEIFIFFL